MLAAGMPDLTFPFRRARLGAVSLRAFSVVGPLAGLVGAALLLIGEIGLWVGAACLGLTLFKKRKAMLNRLLGRRPAAPSEV